MFRLPIKELQKLADKKDTEAQVLLAVALFSGTFGGFDIPRDCKKAEKLLQTASLTESPAGYCARGSWCNVLSVNLIQGEFG